MQVHDTRYARAADGAYIAYQTIGDGPVDVACLLDIFGNLDVLWEDETFGELFRGLSSFSRLILHDRRGTGLSSRNVDVPNLETRVEDLRAVLDAADASAPALLGLLEGGAPGAMLAAVDPERVRSFVWYGPTARALWAPDFPWGVGADYHEREQQATEVWGTRAYGKAFMEAEAPLLSVPPTEMQGDDDGWLGLMSRQTCTPDVARELSRVWFDTDIRGLLPSVRCPVLLVQHPSAPEGIEEMHHVASLLPNTTEVIVPGVMLTKGVEHVVEAARSFLGVDPPRPELDTVLATVLFTDIVGSTRRQAALGDHAWKDLVERHHAAVRAALHRWHGVENDTAGDGFYATFDGPARAIRCALEVVQGVRDLDIEVRAGLHTGECELIDGKIGGLAVSIGARVAARAAASEVLISQTVKDLVAGSGLALEDAGAAELKGVPDRWRLYRVVGP